MYDSFIVCLKYVAELGSVRHLENLEFLEFWDFSFKAWDSPEFWDFSFKAWDSLNFRIFPSRPGTP